MELKRDIVLMGHICNVVEYITLGEIIKLYFETTEFSGFSHQVLFIKIAFKITMQKQH